LRAIHVSVAAAANAHRIPVEPDRPERERGTYLHPEAFAQPAKKGVKAARHPEISLQALQAGERPVQTQ